VGPIAVVLAAEELAAGPIVVAAGVREEGAFVAEVGPIVAAVAVAVAAEREPFGTEELVFLKKYQKTR
jgi:hypothetical protein